jgi:LysM domain
VQAGNTLFAIALATNSTVDELRTVNCIANIDNITAGDILFVPRPPRSPIVIPQPSGGRAGLMFIGCTDFRTQITNLIAGQRVQGTFIVQGSAFRDDFWYYKIEIRPDWADVYNFYSRSDTPASNGVLGEVNSEIFGEGLHWVRLSVVDLGANIQPDAICEIPVIFG